MKTIDKNFYAQLKKELTKNILPFWEKNAKDKVNGGFYGAIKNDGTVNPDEWRGIVMVSRFLWAYSAAALLLNDEKYLKTADYAYDYLIRNFSDNLNGGFFWSVKSDGTPLVRRKQIYGDAFALYAISEYAQATAEMRKNDNSARFIMNKAISVYELLEKFARDYDFGGYAEALNEDWSFTKDTKLSPKDIDCDKSMNTNLHVMEAYTNLYRTLPVVCPENKVLLKKVGESLTSLVRVHLNSILNSKDCHLDLYFNKKWKMMGEDEISYGHDIESSWLLWEAANVLGNKTLINEVKPVSVRIAEVSLAEGFDQETGGFENTMSSEGKRDTTRIWWNQAEALNGFYYAWKITGKAEYEDAVLKEWNWICKYQKDKENGDWFWAVSKKGKPALKEVKGGNWKTCYHNARCCMELLKHAEI